MSTAAFTPALPRHQGTFTTPDGLQLFEQSWLPEDERRSTVVIVHGIAEHSGRYAHVASYLTQRGHAVHTFDLRGHGRSEGPRVFVRSFDEYLDDLHLFLQRVRKEAPEQPLFLLGHSMGGTIAALYALERSQNLSGLILSSPMIRFGGEVPKALQWVSGIISALFPRLPTMAVDRALISHDAAIVAEAEKDPLNYHGRIRARPGMELLRAGRRVEQQMGQIKLPVLVIHGTDDHLTEAGASADLYRQAASTDKTLSFYEGLYHETLNEPEKEEILSGIANWLDEHLAAQH